VRVGRTFLKFLAMTGSLRASFSFNLHYYSVPASEMLVAIHIDSETLVAKLALP
jgi:hypothetical protein